MRWFNLILTGIAKLAALFILFLGLIALLCADQMVPLTLKISTITHGPVRSYHEAVVFWLMLVAIYIYVGITGLVRWRVP